MGFKNNLVRIQKLRQILCCLRWYAGTRIQQLLPPSLADC